MIARKSSANGTATVSGIGSAWTNSGALSVGFEGTGTLNIQDGGSVSNRDGYVGRKVGSTGTATVTGIVNLEADVTPGSSPGLATYGGDVNFGVLSNLEIEIAGTTKGDDYDSVDAAGSSSIGGALTVSFLDGFEPSQGDVFEILTTGQGVNGTFLSESLPSLSDPTLQWQLDYTSDAVLLSVVLPFVLGDMNGDGALTNGDIAPFVQALTDPSGYASTFPTLDPDQRGDFTGDGSLTNGDIAGFVNALTGGGPGNVPEPTSLALLGSACLMLKRRR